MILDRYFYSTFVYHSELITVDFPKDITDFYGNLTQPDLVIFLDVPQRIRKDRINKRKEKLQWYGDEVSLKRDLTNNYFELFAKLKTNVLKVDNHKNTVEQTVDIIRNEISKI